jgi:adenylate cyclase
MGIGLPQERPRRRAGPVVLQDDGQTVLLSRAAPAPTRSWEQKQVAVLAVEVTWPASNEARVSPYEPWTVISHWEQTIVEKVQGFGGVVLPHPPSLVVAVFGVPLMLEQAPQRAVQVALTLRLWWWKPLRRGLIRSCAWPSTGARCWWIPGRAIPRHAS